jgi:serine/threonine protein kinase
VDNKPAGTPAPGDGRGDRFSRVEQIYHQTLERPEEERRAFLAQACDGDDDLRREAEELLSFDNKAGSFIESPAVNVAARALAGKAEQGKKIDLVGQTILHYRVLEKIGEGGMGIVYKALDTRLQRQVAIKVLPPEIIGDRERRRRLVQEARAASALNHPNIITIHDIDHVDGTDFIAMEYVSGKTLAELIPRKGMQLSLALKYAVQIADALARAHGAGIIHRDLKPSNVMVDDHGLVKVLDFGLAKLMEDSGPEAETVSTRTVASTIVGTPSYMSPEQAEGKPIDTRSDIFSFGSMFYEMLAGQRPFRGDARASTIASILREEPKPISQVVEGLPRDAEKIVRRCLRKDPERRFQTMADLRVALEDLKEESDSGVMEGAGGPDVTARGKLWWTGVLAGASVIAVVLGLVLWIVLRITTPPPPPPVTTPLTSEEGFELDPAISPDGKQLAWIRGPKGRQNVAPPVRAGARIVSRVRSEGPAHDRVPHRRCTPTEARLLPARWPGSG